MLLFGFQESSLGFLRRVLRVRYEVEDRSSLFTHPFESLLIQTVQTINTRDHNLLR